MYRAKALGESERGAAVWAPKRGADRNVVPVFSERLKKFKSNANEGKELNILGWREGAKEERRDEGGKRETRPKNAKLCSRGEESREELCGVVGVAALSHRELVQD